MSESSWENFSSWYDQLVGQRGHYYHEHVILPRLLPLLALDSFAHANLLDLGCGQGVLQRALPPQVGYHGIDLSPNLVKMAKKSALSKSHSFAVGDITAPLEVKNGSFSHAVFLLSLQNVEDQKAAIFNAAAALMAGGMLVLVLNHPCFRIPRQSSWGIDEAKKLQYRRLDSYLSPMSIPIKMGYGGDSESSMSYHYPLSSYSDFLKEANLFIVAIEEWISDKKSTGGAKRMEDRARSQFPLFLTIVAKSVR